MKLLFAQQVQFADGLVKLEERQERLAAAQERTSQQIAELTGTQILTMKAITTLVATVGDIAEAQKRTDATVAALARRIDAFIAALGNGNRKSP